MSVKAVILLQWNKDFSTAEARRLAKITMRAALASCLGGKKLRSRELFL